MNLGVCPISWCNVDIAIFVVVFNSCDVFVIIYKNHHISKKKKKKIHHLFAGGGNGFFGNGFKHPILYVNEVGDVNFKPDPGKKKASNP